MSIEKDSYVNLKWNSKPSTPFLNMAHFVDSERVQQVIVFIIFINAIVLGLETSPRLLLEHGFVLRTIDRICLVIFFLELALKLIVHRANFFRCGWNVFDFLVVSIALIPGAGVWAVLRSLRVLRVLRLLTVIPSLRKVVGAFLHSIPGLAGVAAIMGIFFYTAGVLATKLFGQTHPEWFGAIPESLYTLFQIMTLESWSMGIVRPVMASHPWAWAFFVPFIVIATFTILNLFIGIIVSTMQELSIPTPPPKSPEFLAIEKMQKDLESIKEWIEKKKT